MKEIYLQNEEKLTSSASLHILVPSHGYWKISTRCLYTFLHIQERKKFPNIAFEWWLKILSPFKYYIGELFHFCSTYSEQENVPRVLGQDNHVYIYRQNCRLSICSSFGFLWQILNLRRAGLSTITWQASSSHQTSEPFPPSKQSKHPVLVFLLCGNICSLLNMRNMIQLLCQGMINACMESFCFMIMNNLPPWKEAIRWKHIR